MRVAPHRALTEDDQRARQNVGALHRDGDRCMPVGHPQQVLRPPDDALASQDVHAVIDGLATRFGQVHLENGAGHARALTGIQCRRRVAPRRVRGIEPDRHAGNDCRYRMELAYGQAELLADLTVAVNDEQRGLLQRGAQRGQRNGPPSRQALHEHAPALANLRLAADDPVHGHENIRSAHRPVHEGRIHWQVTPAHLHAVRWHRNEGAGDAQHLLIGRPCRINGLERETNQRRHRSERDVALVEIHEEASYHASIDFALGQHAAIRNRSRVGARIRRGQRKARQIATARETRKVMGFLPCGAVAQQQLRRAQGVRHHHGDGSRHIDGGDARNDRGVREVAETEPAVFAGNHHAEEPALTQKLPHFGRKVAGLVDGELVQHGIEHADFVVEESLLLRSQPVGADRAQCVKIGPASKQLALESHRACFKRVTLGAAHGRQRTGKGTQRKTSDQSGKSHAGLLLNKPGPTTSS